MTPTVIVDPAWEMGGTRARVEAALASAGLGRTEVVTGTEPAAVATQALAAGSTYLVAAGDDRTTAAVANAMLDRDDHHGLILGVLPLAPSDLPRTFGLPQQVEAACVHLAGEHVYELDAAYVAGPAGARWFIQVAEVGVGATMARLRGRAPGRLRAFAAFWRALASSRIADVALEGKGRTHRFRTWNLVLGNCQFGSGGARLSPRSYPGDGVLDVLVMRGPRSQAFTLLPAMMRGEHVPSFDVAELRSAEFQLTAEPPLPVQLDGEPFGTTPLRVRLEPKALRLKV